ncbi:hypothetical protein DSO57_1024895 [Entomophthora muscae]|nr:hypothetical protein DSO57_1024895 [Entomophthora muscae]
MMCWFFRPHLLPPSYEKWITRFANVDKSLIDYLRGIQKGTIVEGQHSDCLAEFCRSVGLNPHLGDPYYGVPSCRALHHLDGDSCTQAAGRRFFSTSAAAFMSLYFPLNLLTYLIKRRKKSEQKENAPPKTFATELRESILIPSARSSAFLGMFVASIFGTVCLLRRKLGTDQYGVVAGSAVCGVSSILIESPSRRLNLALYVLPRALTSLHQGKFEKYIPARLLDTPMMIISLATLLTCHQIQPRSVQAPTRALLSWIFSKYSL